jgi:hypothetical protein
LDDRGGLIIRLEGFSPAEEAMIRAAETELQAAGYTTETLQVVVRVDMPAGYRAMTLPDGAALGSEALTSQAMLNHVLEEELLHHAQKAQGPAKLFGPGTARALEEEVDEQRRFPLPES